MKTLIRTVFVLLYVLVASTGYAQRPQDDPKYGDTPEEREKTLAQISLFTEYVKQDNFKDAINSWRFVFTQHPGATKNTFTAGEKIMVNMMTKNQKNAAVFNAYFDTLMLVYDKRIEFFGEKGDVLGRKGVAVLKYQKSRFIEAYQYLSESVKLEGVETSAATASTFMQTSVAMYKSGKHEASQVVEDFGMAMDVLEPAVEKARIDGVKLTGKQQEKAKRRFENLKIALKNVELLFMTSGAATCEHLVNFYTPKFNEDPNNLAQLQKITKFLDNSGCEDTDLFAKAAEQQYKLEPSSRAAYALARMFMKKNDMAKSAEYYSQAFDLESKTEAPDEEFQAKVQYQLAAALFAQNKYAASRTACRKALEYQPNWGKPYIMIAKLYAASGSTCANSENLDAGAVYWAAYDKLAKAKSIDSEVADEANELMAKYKKYFPKKEEAFFHGITEGKSYTVGCWINETTTARF